VTKHSSLLRFTVAVALVATLGASACSSSKKSSSSTGGSTDSAAVALLPASFKSAGELKIGTDASYAPNEYRDANNKIVGFDIDLMNAIAARLGLKTSYENGQFDSLIASIAGGKYDAGISSFTDKKEREAVVDFVTYYNDGTQWAATKGKAVDPDNACGLKVAVESGTTQADDVTARSKVCTDAGKPAITVDKYDTQDLVNTNVALGKDDAQAADSPVVAYAAQQSQGKIVLVGKVYDAAPYGIAISKKNSGLTKAIQKALQDMMDDGSYAKITAKWELSGGNISTAKINGALT